MFNIDASVSVGEIDVITTDNRGHPIEKVAQMAADKIMYVSDQAPPPIRDQAQAFKETLKVVILSHMQLAVEQDRATICSKLRKNGYSELADNLRSL